VKKVYQVRCAAILIEVFSFQAVTGSIHHLVLTDGEWFRVRIDGEFHYMEHESYNSAYGFVWGVMYPYEHLSRETSVY